MVKDISDAEFNNEVLEHDGVTIVDFWAPWCGPCRILGPTIEELAAEYEGRAKIVKLNVDENQTAGRYGIQSIPTLLFFQGGEVIDTVVGLQSKEALASRLDGHLQTQ